MNPSWAQILTWIIVIAGWLVINRQANRREDRKEIRQALDEVTALSEKIVLLAENYHCRHDPSDDLEILRSRIKNLLQDMALRIQRLEILKYQEYQLVAKLRKAITLNHFESFHTTPLRPDDPQLLEIETARLQLIDQLESNYVREYRSKKWSIGC